MVREAIAAGETMVRAFLLGFGWTIVSQLLFRDKDLDQLGPILRKGAVVGLGLACTLVGAALFVPHSWRGTFLTDI